MRVVTAQPGSEITRQVVALGDRNAKFLGHFAESLYHREAGKGRIIAMVDESDVLLGYVLFRTTRERVVVQHLCVDESARGIGVATKLLEDLKARTRHLGSIVCHCAREFDQALSVWKRLGFVPMGEKAGRGSTQRPLIRLVFDQGHTNLFSQRQAELAAETIVAVMDLNVALALQDLDLDTGRVDPGINALRSDWLLEEVSLWVTDESLVEVERQDEVVARRRRMAQLRGIPAVVRRLEHETLSLAHIAKIMGPPGREQAASDRRQLAQAISGDADVFLTRDQGILRHAESIERTFGLVVFQPSDLVLRLDEISRAGDYVPARLHGSAIDCRLLRQSDIEGVVNCFLNYAAGEQRHRLSDVVRRHASDPMKSQVLLVEGGNNGFRAMIAWARTSTDELRVSLLRVHKDRLAETLTRHLLYLATRESLRLGCSATVLTDPFPIHPVRAAADTLGFLNGPAGMVKWSLRGLRSREQLAQHMERALSQDPGTLAPLASVIDLCRAMPRGAERDAVVEQRVWPGVLRDSELRTFVVPIRPRYARHLFDPTLSTEQLFGADPALLLNCENVYYRSSYVEVVCAPSRVLWYVSSDRLEAVQELRASSAVLGTEVGPARDLFRKYRRLGVYEWGDLSAMTAGDRHGEVMAIRFGPTECFTTPLDGTTLRELIGTYRGGGPPPLTMPVEVPPPCFERISELCYGK